MKVILVGGKYSTLAFSMHVECSTWLFFSCIKHTREHHVYAHPHTRPEMHWLRLHCVCSDQCRRLPTRMVHALRPRRPNSLYGRMGQDRWRSRPARQLAPWSRVHASRSLNSYLYSPSSRTVSNT
jgi:hypothetical protein